MNIYEKLLHIQNELKAPKGQYNSFGKYKYRSCEDILEAVKPICFKYKVTLILSDELEDIGDRYYIKATATLLDIDEEKKVQNTAYAREADNKKGMDESQITGTASSYARKYALNGLFNIDDTKDADTDEFVRQNNSQENNGNAKVTQVQAKTAYALMNQKGWNVEDILTKKYGKKNTNELTMNEYAEICNACKDKE